MSEAPARHEPVTLTIDGTEVTVPKGTLIIRAAEQLGVEIPRFCDHPMLDPVAACRQCYVKVEGQRKLMTSCSTPVAPGMVVSTQFTDAEVKDAQEAVLEFLLINHPLDCPICDRGGECPLQDQALAYGTGVSRYIEPKRTYRKPLPLSPLVNLDRERCVLCARCTRFCDQISGDRFIELFDRGPAERVSIAPGEDFDSPFSGNTIQICPVGALTATTYRFSARPFDLRAGDSICPHCACGCNLRVDTRRGQVVRHLAHDNEDVNDAWLCDKGRFAFAFPDRLERLTSPRLREHGLEPVAFAEALSAVAGRCRGARVGILAGGRLSDEDAFALSKLARTVFVTNDLDHGVGGGEVPLEVEARQARGMPVTNRDVEGAKVVLLVGIDAEQELPILHLRVRKAARAGARVFVVHPRRTRLWDVAEHVLCPPGREAGLLSGTGDAAWDGVTAALAEAGAAGVVLAGPRLADSPGAVAAAASVAERAGSRFALLCRRANDRGTLVAGVHPDLLPGGRPVADAGARAEVERAWGSVLPAEPGRDASAILAAAAARELDVLFLVGTDPLRDHPDVRLARRALENVRYKVVVDIAAGDLDIYADASLPGLPVVEKDGHYTNWEGRAQRFRPVREPLGQARSEWRIFQGLSEAMDHDLGFHSLDDLHAEMGALLASAPEAVPDDAGPPGTAETTASPAEHDPHDLVLFAYPLLVDEGRLSAGADLLKEAFEQEAFVEVSTADAERLGLAHGATARVRTEAGEATLPVRVSEHLVAGAVFVPWNQPGFAANTILSGSRIAPVTLEPIEAAAPAEAVPA